jgi:hypothetical protein
VVVTSKLLFRLQVPIGVSLFMSLSLNQRLLSLLFNTQAGAIQIRTMTLPICVSGEKPWHFRYLCLEIPQEYRPPRRLHTAACCSPATRRTSTSHPERPHFAEDDTVRYVKTQVIAFINYKGIRSAEFQSFLEMETIPSKSEAITVKPGMPVRDES